MNPPDPEAELALPPPVPAGAPALEPPDPDVSREPGTATGSAVTDNIGRDAAGVSSTAAAGSAGDVAPGRSASWFPHRVLATVVPSVMTRSPAGNTSGFRVQ
jgi:hypothetical protein